MGYGARALELLTRFYEGSLCNLFDEPALANGSEKSPKSGSSATHSDSDSDSDSEEAKDDDETLQTENLRPRSNLSPLLEPLDKRRPGA